MCRSVSIRMNSSTISVPAAPVSTGQNRLALSGLNSGTSWTLAGSVAAAFSQWLLFMVTAKLGSAEMVGQLALSFAIVAPIQALTDLALRPALATDARRDFHFRDYLKLRGIMVALAVAAIGAMALWRGGAASPIIVAIGLQKAIESASDLFFGLFQREDRLQWMGQSVVLRSTLASIAFVMVMLVYRNLLIACLAGLVVRIGVFLLHDLARGSLLPEFASVGRSPNGRVGQLLKASLPLAFGLFLMSFSVNIPRYFVEERMGVAALGIFAALIYVFQAGAMLIDAVSQAACAKLARYHVSGNDRAFQALLFKLFGFAIAVALGGLAVGWLGGGALLRVIYSAAFADAAKPFAWLSLCALPWYCSSVLGYALVARRQMTPFFFCQVATLATALGGSFWMIQQGSNLSGLSNACRVIFLIYSGQLVLYSAVLWMGRKAVA